MHSLPIGRARRSFWLKPFATLGLVALADRLFFGQGIGATLGGFALLWLGTVVVLRPATRQSALTGRALTGSTLVIAVVVGIVLVDHPSLIGWTLFWIAITVAAISPRCAWIGDGWAWTGRILAHAWWSFVGPLQDCRRLQRLPSPRRLSLPSTLAAAALPIGGSAVFLALFASANPIIAQALSSIRLPNIDLLAVLRMIALVLIFIGIWATLRPARCSIRKPYPRTPVCPPRTKIVAFEAASSVSATSVIVALFVFNALFAIENALDLAFLWSGAGPPAGITLAQYAHRGAYPLIATALLAGGFSVFFLREGSATAARPSVRRLVGLWVAQNVMLCASSILRTVDYVQAYSLTAFRVAALLWMGLVTIGLALIGWRILRNKSRAWLINANFLALGIVLFGVSAGDLGAVAAAWNVRHARDVGGTGAELDVCYLQSLGSSALLPVISLEQRGVGAVLRGRLDDVRRIALANLDTEERSWALWTWRGQRRLAAARAALRRSPVQDDATVVNCYGQPYAPLTHLTPQAKP